MYCNFGINLLLVKSYLSIAEQEYIYRLIRDINLLNFTWSLKLNFLHGCSNMVTNSDFKCTVIENHSVRFLPCSEHRRRLIPFVLNIYDSSNNYEIQNMAL